LFSVKRKRHTRIGLEAGAGVPSHQGEAPEHVRLRVQGKRQARGKKTSIY
jgi:hypothetical protein